MGYPLSANHPMGEKPKTLSAALSLCPLWLDLPFLG